ncbi:MAG TPA: class I SAM-dependent methyltransferase [Pirellulales bacterium]|jgi:2-polyprenyl-6-hydroxyphenyl methylase/3-demethylubiquinone-9 3-methyltransferase
MTYVNQEAAEVSGETIGFSFGANWKRFLAAVDEPVIAKAVQSFVNFTHLKRLDDYDFLDLGCGSGLSSLVALRLGARRVLSIDIDPNSIDCARNLRQTQGIDESRWEIRHGSVLDEAFLESLGRFSYVYSWGVLHHTGSLWRAVDNVLRHNVEGDGVFHTALYNTTPSSARWLKIKRICNRSPHFLFPVLSRCYAALLLTKMLTRFRSPIRFLRDYRQVRGMTFLRDIDDWFGGLPYEYCTPDETVDFLADHGFSLLRLRTTRSNGCNEFLFRAGGALGVSA